MAIIILAIISMFISLQISKIPEPKDIEIKIIEKKHIRKYIEIKRNIQKGNNIICTSDCPLIVPD